MPETGIFGTGASVGVAGATQRQFVLVGHTGFRHAPFEHSIPDLQSVFVEHVVPQYGAGVGVGPEPIGIESLHTSGVVE